jgi:hypothetical protein
VRYTCARCGATWEDRPSRIKRSRSGLSFCGRECKELSQRIEGGIEEIQPDHYGKSGGSYRKMLAIRVDPECVDCGYQEDERMLDADHIDSDRSNNSLENLQWLCVWCHALKTRAGWPRK